MDEEKEVVAPEQSDGWDKDRQRLDQLSANVTKIAGEKAELTTQLTEMSQRSQDMQDTVARLEQQLSNAQIAQQTETDSLDSDLYDDKLIKKISNFEAEIASTKKALVEANNAVKELQDARSQYEQNAENEREASRKAQRKEAILTDLDKEFGSKFRNEALKLAQEEVDQTGKAPDGEYAVGQLLRKHYRSLASATGTTKNNFSPVQVDTGDGGVAFNEGEIKEGSRDDVMAQIRAKYRGKSFSMPKT